MSMAAERHEPDPDESPCLAMALKLLSIGLWPVPIHGLDAPVRNPGKQPIGEGWGLIRHTPETLRTVFSRNPGAGVGIKLGKEEGVIDVEIDDRETGEATLATMFGGEGVPTCGWEARKGSHRLFHWDDRLASYGKTILKGSAFPGVEIRLGSSKPGGQFQSVVPPTPNTDGTPRTWNDCDTIADLPEAFFAYLDTHVPKPDPNAPPARTIPIYTPGPGEWSAEDRARAYLARIEPAVSGQAGHNKTFRAACQVGPGFDLPMDRALALLRDWNQVCNPPWTEKELLHKVGDAYEGETRRGWLLTAGYGATKATNATKGGSESRNGDPYVANVDFVAGHDVEDEPVEARHWPDPPEDAAYHGVMGEFIEFVLPYTEADPVGVLIQGLVGWGNLIGRKAYFNVGATRHHLNLFACTTGPTASGRKGTAWDVARMALAYCDPDWAMNCIKGGLSSGEGLIWEVRDPIFKREPIRDKGKIVDYQQVESDPGIPDKRLMVVETELGGTLKVLTREGNTLSAQIRHSWDSGMLRSMTKNNPARSTDAHVSIIGHITEEEVNKFLTQTDAANGFANRFLWVAVRQSKLLPRGALIPAEPIRPTLEHLQAAAAFAATEPIRLGREAEAESLWEDFYSEQSKGKPGLLGAILARATPQAMRLASLYALIDLSEVVRLPHLEAALALWRYCERSAAYIFGTLLGDRDADILLSALRSTPEGLTQSQIVHDVFRRHKTKQEVSRTLGRLLEYHLIRSESVPTEGRPKTVWHAVRHAT